VQVVELEGREVGEVLGVAVERAQHLRWRDAAGQWCGEERSCRQADIDVEVGGLAVDEEVVEGFQAAELVRAAGDRSPCEYESDGRILLPRREVAFVNDGEAHLRSLAPPRSQRSRRARHPRLGSTVVVFRWEEAKHVPGSPHSPSAWLTAYVPALA